MKKCYLDANILIGFKDQKSIFFIDCKRILKQLANNNYHLFISPLVLDEFLFQFKLILISKKQKDIFKKLTMALRSILDLPRLKIINPPKDKKSNLKIIFFMEKLSLRPRDAYHLLIMKENKISYFATFDKDFNKVFRTGVIKRFTV